jgi:hypothetical protein
VARDRTQILCEENLLKMQTAPAHPELELDFPILSWEPGFPMPDLGALSYQLQSRWKQHPVSTVCVSATKKAANRFAGHGGRFPRPVERTHDIHLARVYLAYRSLGPVAGWTFEESLRERQQKNLDVLPDVLFENGGRTKVIEFGGAYPKPKLEKFHAYCKGKKLPYEVW